MSRDPAELEIRVHLTDARVLTFAVKEEHEARRVLSQIIPGKFFESRQIVLGCAEDVTAFQSTLLTQVELVSAYLPTWPFHHNVRSIHLINAKEYHDILKSQEYIDQPLGDVVFMISEIELTNGERLYLKLEINSDPAISPLTPLDQHIFLQQLFTSGGLHVLHGETGIILINPAHITRLTMHPGPGAVPTGAWHASRVLEERELQRA